MKATVSALVAVAALLSTACGAGRAIFNVDVYSFLAGTGKDTVPYVIPPATSASASTTQKINLPPGFGSSIVDSVRITSGGANLINTGGTGTIGLELYVAADSLGTLNASALALSIPPTPVTGPGTFPVVIRGDLSPGLNSLFTKATIWLRIRAIGTNAGVTPVTGRMVLTGLQLRVVLQDKIF
jgi:hypothetical protein